VNLKLVFNIIIFCSFITGTAVKYIFYLQLNLLPDMVHILVLVPETDLFNFRRSLVKFYIHSSKSVKSKNAQKPAETAYQSDF